ncbi:hypothetical protein PI125_g16130 [Phytophthora idaei]|nr:hypothetical protein PI125_g16130 [Phytophthora idaei]KAG3143488.1 hypothetical protein PI126_g14602 [Phytophthora idaei]
MSSLMPVANLAARSVVLLVDGQFGKLSATMSDSEPEVHVPSAGLWESSLIAKEWHGNWKAFKDYMERYQEDTHQLFRLRSSTSVARRNVEIKDHAGGSSSETSDSGPMLIPQEFKTFWAKYICTHGWRRKSRSPGQRKTYFGKSTECKADVKAAVTWNKEKRKFMVRATGSSTSHNHRVDRAVYENHPSVRRVEDPVLLVFVDVMQSSGSKPKRIMHFLREKTGHNVTLRDVHNMVARMREERRGSDTVEQRLETLLQGFCGRRGNRASVFVDDESLAQTITLQTRQVRRWFKAFPDVLLVDATHNTNDTRYKLF